MGMSWDNVETTRDFVKVWDISKNAKARTIVEVICFNWFLAAHKPSQRLKRLIVVCFAHTCV